MEPLRGERPPQLDNVGELTVSHDRDGNDVYDFGTRAVVVREVKEEHGLGEMEPLPSPWTVEIEPTLLCNARCHFCSYEEDIAAFKQERMALPVANRPFGLTKDTVFGVLDDLRKAGTTKGIFWSGGGDPLVWRYIVESMKYAGEFAQNSVQTNGIGLGKVLKDPEAVDALDLLTVSVYADNAAQHRQIAGVDSFEKVTENIRKAVEARDTQNPDMKISAKLMVDTHNFRNVPEIVAFYRGLGVNAVGLREVQDYNYGGEGQRAESVELTQAQKEELVEIINSADRKDAALRAFARTVVRSQTKPTVTSHCFNAIDGHFACIDARGKVFTGNPEIGDERYEIGNVIDARWSDIWKGERHREVIKAMDTAQQLGTCASQLCRHVRANVGVEQALKDPDRQPVDKDAAMRNLGAFL